MRMKLALLLFLAACGNSSSTPVDGSATGDTLAPDGSHPPTDAGATALPVVLVGADFGSVRDFAVGADAIYPILNLAGHYTLVRCPLTGCSATPQVIGQVGTSTSGRGVAIAGSTIFWLSDDHTIMRAALDGTGVAQRYQFLTGQIAYPLRASGTELYFHYIPTSFKPVVMKLDEAGTAAPTALVSTQATNTGFDEALDVSGGKLAYWQDEQGLDPHPIQVLDLASHTITTVASSIDASAPGFALATSGIAWVESQTSTADVRACLFGTTCDATSVGVPTFVALAVAGDQVFFGGRTSDNYATVVTCDLQHLAARTCTPAPLVHPSSQLDLLNLRALQVTADAVYAGTDAQGSGAFWRIDR
ncbi:MAG: hypothetical protein ABI678_18340 [Kofleriaceae bacterium]